MKHKNVRDVLKCAKRLLINRGWCQGSYAIDSEGFMVDEMDRSAAKFCMLGALRRCDTNGDFIPKANQLLEQVCRINPVGYNDNPIRTKREVLAKYDEAIKLAQRPSRSQD